mmetsp:Transcript_12086/g.20464  ORF Transcript_12086/g.20464 Transcript_12086/m.20464 type:complete len:401 (+) Transcript_12086:1497-2699(+)
MMEEAPPNIKRRRISAADGSPQDISSLTDLPSGILAHAASFLAAPSRALFAVALDENSAASPNERSSAIVVGSQWDVLDFGEIEKDLADEMTDDTIEKVLLCIVAVNNVKRLKLTNCFRITGAGLEPLRGSAIIEQIDLSIVGEHENPDIGQFPMILCDRVLPILDSIVEREGCALKHIQFPFLWRCVPSTESDFHAFCRRYNQMWRNREEIRCLGCNTRLPTGGNQWIETGTYRYGTQRHTCYDCFKHYCYSCENVGELIRMLACCEICKRDYCTDCSKMHVCRCCSHNACNDCYKHECHKCNEKICLNCVEGHEDCYQCEECDRLFCSECSDPGVTDFSRNCGVCHDISCDDCRFRRFQLGQHECAECIKTIVPLVADEYKRLRQENEQLKLELKSKS